MGRRTAPMLIVGLAPGLHGANKTGIPFTGDFSGELLFATLDKLEISPKKRTPKHIIPCAITNAVRCVPPENRPSAEEVGNCRPFLDHQIRTMTNLRAIVCLGKIAHDSVIRAVGLTLSGAKFSHGAIHKIENSKVRIFDTYHCSRYNVNTRRLTASMFEDIFASAKSYILSP